MNSWGTWWCDQFRLFDRKLNFIPFKISRQFLKSGVESADSKFSHRVHWWSWPFIKLQMASTQAVRFGLDPSISFGILICQNVAETYLWVNGQVTLVILQSRWTQDLLIACYVRFRRLEWNMLEEIWGKTCALLVWLPRVEFMIRNSGRACLRVIEEKKRLRTAACFEQ